MSEEISVWKAIANLLKAIWGLWKAKKAEDSANREQANQQVLTEVRETLQGVVDDKQRAHEAVVKAGDDAGPVVDRQLDDLGLLSKDDS